MSVVGWIAVALIILDTVFVFLVIVGGADRSEADADEATDPIRSDLTHSPE